MARLLNDGAELYYEDTGGEHEVVVVLHGAAGASTAVKGNVASLSAGRRVIAPDLRGMGRSEPVEVVAPDAWVGDLMALMDHLGIARFAIAGTSLGARVALKAAAEHPDRVTAVLADAPILADTDRGSEAVVEKFGAGMPPEMRELMRAWHGDSWRERCDRYLVLRESPGLQGYLDLRHTTASIGCPVLVTRGDIDDPIHTLADAVDLHARLADTRLWIAPETRFSTMRFRPEDWARTARSFLDEAGGAHASTPHRRSSTTELPPPRRT